MHFFLPCRSLNSFGDVILLRDPRGKSVFRSLHKLPSRSTPEGKARGAGIAVTGPFLIHQIFTISKEQGLAFVNATADENPIHRQDDVVPGAMTEARAVSSLEALFPRLGISRLKIKFRSIATYGRPMRQQLAISFRGPDAVDATFRLDQEGQYVAEGSIAGRIYPEIQRPHVSRWRVNREELKRVEEFFLSLAISPDLYLRAGGEPNYSYPRGFLASLPSGEMVRKLAGEGGLLTSLDLEFPEGPPPGITGSGRPEVSIETARARPTFWKILTWIKQGVEEHCKGFALVFAPNPAAGPA